METIFLLAVLTLHHDNQIPPRKVMLHVYPHPKILIDQINGFSRKVAAEIKDGLREKNEFNGKQQNNIGFCVYCDGAILDLSKELRAAIAASSNSEIESSVKDITNDMKKKLSYEIICNSKFCDQSMHFVKDWEMLL